MHAGDGRLDVCAGPIEDPGSGRLRLGRSGRFGVAGRVRGTQRVGACGLRRAIVYGSVLASFVVEDFSIDRFRRLNQKEILERFKAFHKLSHFDDTLKLPQV